MDLGLVSQYAGLEGWYEETILQLGGFERRVNVVPLTCPDLVRATVVAATEPQLRHQRAPYGRSRQEPRAGPFKETRVAFV